MSCKVELTKIYDSKGIDGLSRLDRRKSSSYNRQEFLFDKYLQKRKEKPKLDLTHHQILELGNQTFIKFRATTPSEADLTMNFREKLQEQIERVEAEADQFRTDLEKIFQRQLAKERDALKKKYDDLMARIEKQRDQLEQERIKEVIRKMNEECEMSLKKQWKDAEDLRRKTYNEMEELAREKVANEMEVLRKKAVQDALDQAEVQFKIREAKLIEETKKACDDVATEKLRVLKEKYDLSEDILVKKIKDIEIRFSEENTKRVDIENDFRLLQTDYKRFMNYTNHYNSDYMMKLRHIGDQILEDRQFEDILNEKLESIEERLSKLATNNTELDQI